MAPIEFLRPTGVIKYLINQEKTGRGEKIRTSGPCLPKTVLYQAELHPDFIKNATESIRKLTASGELPLVLIPIA